MSDSIRKLADSRYASRLLEAHPELARELTLPGPFTRGEMAAALEGAADDDEAALMQRLRRLRRRVLLRVMMAVWAEDEEIICVHPGGPRLSGPDEVRSSWARIFSAGAGPRVHITQQVAVTAMMIAVHSVHENFTVEGDARAQVPVIATNVYLRTAAGWRMTHSPEAKRASASSFRPEYVK